MKNYLFSVLLIGTFASVLLTAPAHSDDWPVWRGPGQTGISPDKNWDPKGISKVLWEKRLGDGWSTFTTEGNRVYTMGNSDGEDHIYCLDANTGKEIWKYSYPCSLGGSYKGPRATPVLDNGSVYSFSVDGEVHCVDAKKGTKKWSTNVNSLGAKNITWKYAGSPVINGNLVFINAGQTGIALDKKTGKKVWASSGKGGYAAPVLFKQGSKTQLLIFGEQALFSVDPKTGSKNWSVTWQTKYNVNAADPLPCKSDVFISSGYGRGCSLLSVSSGSASQEWENKSMSSHFTSPVYIKGYIFGVDGNAGRGALVCLEAKSGKEKWREDLGFGSFVVAGDKLIYLNERGTMTVGSFSPSGFKKITSAQVLKGAGKCWTMPVLSNGKIFCRGSNGKMVCLDVSK